MGVDLFFVLSGFLIAGLLLNETKRHKSVDVRRFLVRRGWKIYPLYFMFVGYIILSPVARAVVNGGSPTEVFSDQLSLHWPNLVFLQNYVGSGSIGHLWSIAVEEHFYLLLPLVVGLLGYRHSRKLIWIGFAGVGFFLALRVISIATGDRFGEFVVATHLRLDGLLFGVALRAALEYYPDRFARIRRYRLPLLVFGVACWIPNLWIPVDTEWTRTIGLTLTLLGAAAFLLALYHSSSDDLGRTAPAGRPVIRALCWIGVFSYAIYLWHVTAAGGIAKVTNRTIVAWFGEGQLSWLLSAIVIVSGVVAVGVVATLLVERPLLHLRDRVAPSRAPSLPMQLATTEVEPVSQS
jgi:peptidoglycan/LPS O-acetylase OafA/YrhL